MTPSYALGLFFILCVSLIWAAASVLVQHLYRDMNFDSPFLLTYISTALFVLWIPTRLILERCGRCKRFVQRSWTRARKAVGMGSRYEVMASAELESESEGGRCRDDDEIIIPWRNDMPIAVASSNGGASDNIEMERVREPYQSLISQQERHQKKQSSGNKNNDVATDGYKDEPNGNAINTSDGTLSAQKDSDGKKASPTATNGIAAIGSAHEQPTHQERRRMRPQVLSHLDHMSMAVKIAPVWFVSNFFYNTSLAYTSITSSTVLASTGSLFTFLFAVSCGDERSTAPKLLGVILCFTGSVLTGLGDVESDNNNTGEDGGFGRMLDNVKPTALLSTEATRIILSGVDGSDDVPGSASGNDDIVGSLVLGDLAGLISAIGYGTYTVLIRSLCPRNEDQYSMQLLLGYIGLFNGFFLLPFAVRMAFFNDCSPPDGPVPGYEDEYPSLSVDVASTCERITAIVLAYLIAKALADNVLSDYLWARAVVLTSATVATVGLGLTIPLAFLSDWLLGRSGVTTPESVVGAFSVLVGFLLVNCGEGSSSSSGNSSHSQNDEVESSARSESGHELS